MTREGRAEAAKADARAKRRWFTLILLCHLRQVLVGANIRPPRHMFPKAPWPARWVPPPGTRGIRDTARPVPQDSAAVCLPATLFTEYAWRAFLAMFVWMVCTRSGRIGAVNTWGRATCSA